MSEILKKLLLIKKLIKYEAEQLQKAPIEYKGADDGNFTAPKPKGNKIKEETLPNGLIHTVFHKEAHEHPYGGTVAPATYHVLSHPDLGQLASLELKHYQHKGPAAEGQISPEVSGSEVLPQYRNKGLGKQLYLAALSHHGQFQSDQTVSRGAKGVWDSLKNVPGVKHTDAQYELEDDDNTIVNPEAERDSGESFIAQIVNQGDFDKHKHKMFPAIRGLEVNQKLAASEKDVVSMPKKEFVKEHKKLVNVLRSPSHKDDIEEADEQELELEEELNKVDSPVKINPEHGKIIADAYENMPHNPEHPQVKAAYNALINETKQQYKDLLDNGFKFTKVTDPSQYPYKNSKDMHQDIEHNKHLYYLPTEHGFGNEGDMLENHPLLAPTEFKSQDNQPMTANCLFRQVHDINGHHLANKSGFGPKGEHEAYLEHKKSYSPLAQKALASETLGQNSTVNFGKHSEHNRKNPLQTIFADQKAGLLPEHIINGEWHK